MDFLLIALLTVLNGAFAMSELALASSRKARLVAMAYQRLQGTGIGQPSAGIAVQASALA